MPTPSEIAYAHQNRVNTLAARTAAAAVRLFRRIDPSYMEAGWDQMAPTLAETVSNGQIAAAKLALAYVGRIAKQDGGANPRVGLYAESFAGATKEGRELAPELYTAVTTTKKLIGAGTAIPAAFRSGSGLMALLAGNAVRDASRAADSTVAVAKGFTYSVRVINPGACSRCAILAGVKGYRADFDRHPACRCSSMPLRDDETPEGMFRNAEDYFNALSPAEQTRVFTKAGAEAIRLGADPAKVVNARRGAYKTAAKRADGTYAPARLRPITIGRKADGSPLQVYATLEGTTARGSFGRAQNDLFKSNGERYRRTRTVRLMPEQIMSMSPTPERARELLARYGYIT